MSRFEELQKVKSTLELVQAKNRNLKNDMTNFKYKNSSLRASIERTNLNDLLKMQKDLQDKINETKRLKTKAKLAIDYMANTIESNKQKLKVLEQHEPTCHRISESSEEDDIENILLEHKDMNETVKINYKVIKNLLNVGNQEDDEELFIADSQENMTQ